MAGKTAIKAQKAEIIKKFNQTTTADTGSSEVQIALLTDRITSLNDHFKSFSKDHQSKRGLLKIVGQRRRLLAYLRKTDQKRYSKLIQALELRK